MKTKLTIAAALLATTALSGHAFAQDANAAPPDAASANPPPATQQSPAGQIDELVVTASRVESSAQKTPIAVTVYTGEQLSQQGIHTVQALQTIDPSINIVSSNGAAYVAVRGIASTDVTEIGDPSVPIARDGFFTNRSFNIASSLYDLQRVEILKGPQGTLFGRNSTGGLISVVTAKPTNDFGGFLALEGGSYDLVSTEGALNIPVNDKVQLRLSGYQRYEKGYRRLTGIDDRGDDDNTWSGRAQLAFEPVDGFHGLISYQHDLTKDRGDVSLNGPLETVIDIDDATRFPNAQHTLNRVQADRVRWEFSYDKLPGNLTLFYAGGYDRSRWQHQLDATPPGGDGQVFKQSENPDTWNHEIRIATPTDNRFTLQAGYFHYQEKNSLDSGLLEKSGPYNGRYLIHFNYDTVAKSDAVFGQAGYRITDDLRLTAGARYTWDKKDRTGDAVLDLEVATHGALPFKITTPGNGDISESQPTYHLGLDWQATPRNLLYAKFDTGYKAGGFNSNGSAPSVDYGPEKLNAWEIGSKNRFNDNRLQLNIDGFYQTYDGYQASQTTGVISSGSGVFNIGSAKIYGVEAEGIAVIDQVGRFNVNATFLHARFSDNIGLVTRGDSAGTQADIGGNALPNAPDFAISAGFEHGFEFGNGDTLTARIEGKHASSFYFSVFNDPDTRQKNYTTGNFILRFDRENAPWHLEGYVRNFTNEVVFVNAARNYIGFTNTYEFAAPRTWGVRVRYDF